jgi:hypothetical protein
VKRSTLRGLETWLVVLIALHSAIVGCLLLLATRWGAAFGGWAEVEPLFFARQAGVFHIVVAIGYLLEYFRYRGIGLLLTAKCTALLFLAGSMLVEAQPWVVPLSALGDGAMALVAWIVHRRAR